jgi:DNA modification methylase
MTSITLHAGDNRESLRRLIDQGVRVHSVVTDPPYGLTSVVKRFGKEGSAPAKHGTDGAFSRASGGFMGKVWDGTGIERDPEFWRLIWEILLPGGFVFAFSGSRTGHWQACAMEMAGFIMHPMHGWVYGSGMPKAHNPCPGIDKAMGVKGGRGAPKAGHEGHMGKDNLRGLRDGVAVGDADGGFARPWMSDPDAVEASHYQYAPGSLEAQKWDGWRHGTQSQKPALEPIYLAQKPYDQKTGALNLLKHGVGAVNIDACRVPTNETITTHSRSAEAAISKGIYGDSAAQETHQSAGQALGRWPANLLHDGSEAAINLFPREAGASAPVKGTEPSEVTNEIYGKFAGRVPGQFHGDSGSAARFFHGFALTDEDYAWAIAAGLIDDVPALLEPIRYAGKAKKSDRAGSKHPTVKPISLMEYCITHLTPKGGVVLDPFAGSGTTGEAARRLGFDCILMEAEPEYVDFLRQRFNLPGDELPDDLADLLGDVSGAPVDNDILELLG